MKKFFIAGLLVWIPLGITFWVFKTLVDVADDMLRLLPATWQPQYLLGFKIPGLGLLIVVLVVFGTGVLAANILGKQLLEFWENLLGRIPVVKSIYNAVKQVSDTILSPNGQAFRKALLVQYPRAGAWTIAFQTGVPADEAAAKMAGSHVSVYVPTTPNFTSGFFLMLPRDEVIELDMTVDEALKYVVSMGVVVPRGAPLPAPPRTPRVDTKAPVRN